MYRYIWYFLIYAFLGWCTEVAFKALTTGKFVNRGFLNGPVCPIYGFGMVLVIRALTPVRNNVFLLFTGGFIITTILEYLTGFALEKIFHAKWWDYSKEPLNIKGYVCMRFSIMWGLACVLVMDAIHPLIATFVYIIPVFAGRIIQALLLAALAADAVLTVNTILKLNRQLTHLRELGTAMRRISDDIGEDIFEGVSDIKEKHEDIAVKRAELEDEVYNIRKEIIELRDNYVASTFQMHFGCGRIIRAFPDMKHKKNNEWLEKLRNDIKEIEAEKAERRKNR